MFAITTRQYIQERKEAKKQSTLADIVSPLQVSMGAAVSSQTDETPQNAIAKKWGAAARRILVKYWIWVVALTLFISGITGENMTAFRIIYMALFLTFIFLFQVSIYSKLRSKKKTNKLIHFPIFFTSLAIPLCCFAYPAHTRFQPPGTTVAKNEISLQGIKI